MRLLLDMNLSPGMVAVFEQEGIEAVHWSTVGDPTAGDAELMAYALQRGFVVFTHDLDFGTLLALNHAGGPSVVQVRTQDLLAHRLVGQVASVLAQYSKQLESGALIVIDDTRARIRVLPL